MPAPFFDKSCDAVAGRLNAQEHDRGMEMDEIDIWWGALPLEIDTYITEMAAYVHDLEQKTWGRTHMLSDASL